MTVSSLIQQYELPTLLTYTIVGGWARLDRPEEEYKGFSIDSSSSTEVVQIYSQRSVSSIHSSDKKRKKNSVSGRVS